MLAMGFLLTVPGAAAVGGSEEIPQVVDPVGDVDYHDANSPSHEAPYLDIVAAWIVADDPRGPVGIFMKTADAQPLNDPPVGWAISCDVALQYDTEGQTTGTFTLGYSLSAEDPEPASSVYWTPEETDGARLETVPHDFAYEFAEPGYASFGLQPGAFSRWGDTISEARASCRERFQQGPLSVHGIDNHDGASASISLDSKFYLDASAEAEPENVEADQAQEPLAQNGTSDPIGAEASGVAAVMILLALPIAAFAVGRRRAL